MKEFLHQVLRCLARQAIEAGNGLAELPPADWASERRMWHAVDRIRNSGPPVVPGRD